MLAVAALWIAYLVPHKLRHRQQMLESRTEDRFSDTLRVLAVAGPVGSNRRLRADVARQIRPDCTRVDKRVGLLAPGNRAPIAGRDWGGDVDRPHSTSEGMSADQARALAQLKGAHAAATSRRGAAARRRGVLAGVLALAAVVGWVTTALAVLPLLAGVVPTVLLVTVLALGRRAVVQGEAAEAQWQRRIVEAETVVPVRAARPGRVAAAGHAVRASGAETQAIDQVRPASRRTAVGEQKDGSWSPQPVPRPTYQMKPSAPRREPVPLDHVEASTLDRPTRTTAAATEREAAEEQPAETARSASSTAVPAEATEAAAASGEGYRTAPAALPAEAEPTGSIDLDAVLRRRRAAGE